MACPDFTISTSGRRGVGVIQAHSGLDYPFFAPSEDVRYLVADFYLAYEDKTVNGQYQPPVLPLRIKYLYNFGCVENTPPSGFPTFDSDRLGITVVDANDSVVFDSIANSYTNLSWDWGDDYTVIEWRAPTATCRMLVYKTWPETDDDKHNYDVYLAPVNAVLDSRTLYRIPNRVRSISVKNAEMLTGPYRGDVVFQNGWNTEIAVGGTTTTNLRVDTPITFSAVAGSGDGKYPCEEFDINTVKFITQINGVSGTKGDFILSGKDCIWLRRPTNYANSITTMSATADLQIGADCKPCCACEDYASTALYMNHVRDRYKLIGTRSEEVRSLHETNITRWTDYRNCSVQKPLRVIFVPQRCPYMDAVLLLCNPCESCMPSTTLTLSLSFEGAPVQDEEGEPLAAEIACGYTAMYATGINGLATSIDTPTAFTYVVTFPTLQPGESAYIKFRLKFSIKAAYLVRGVLTGDYAVSGQPITIDCDGESTTPASATTAQMLYCDNSGNTEMPC